MEETIAGTRTLSDTWVLTEPTTLRGSPGACIEGHARDALIRVRAPVTIENLEIRRVARPDGTPSWGSLIVVEPGGELIVSGCRLEGAAHGHIVERGATLGPGEAWVHAGVDVRGTGRAVVQKGEFLQCCLGTLASVYPRTAYLNLEVDACRFEGCAGAVQVSAAGRGSARKSVARGPGAVAYYLQDGELALERCEARDLDTGIAANAGKLKVRGGRVERARVGIRCDGNGVAAARDCTIEGSTGVAAAAAGLGSLELRDCTVAAGAGNGLEVVGAARLDARGGSVEVASAALLALDAGRLAVNGVKLGGTPQWAAYADVAGRIELLDVTLPPGIVEARGAAQAAHQAGPGLDAAAWREVLRARGEWSPAQRKAAAERFPGADAALVAAWVEAGTNGVNAHAAFHGEAATGPLLVGPPRTLARLGRADVSAITGIDAGCLVACTDGTLARVGEGGVTARDRTSSRCVALVCTPSHVVALSAGSGHSVQGVSLHAPATLALLAQDATRSPLVALRLGDPHVLISVDDGGHPTDRCTWRYEWRPPAPVGPPEAIAQGNDVPDGPWTWTGPTWFRHDRPTTMLGAYLVEASDGRLRAHDASKRCLLVLPLADVSALGVSPDGGTLYAGTTSGEVLAMTVTRGS